jgi:hypothetical protein
MRPPTRPFTVETKSRRRALQSAQPSWSQVIDVPSPEELPSRDIREDISAPEGHADPLAAANSVFSAFARNAISTAASFGGLAASVFTPARPQDHAAAETTPASPPPIQDAPARRVLPSLLPINRFENSQDDEPASVKAKPAVKKPGKPSRKPVRARRSADEVPPVSEKTGSDLVTQRTLAPEPKAEFPRTQHKPKWRRAEARVRPGERWKRRLPEVCR